MPEERYKALMAQVHADRKTVERALHAARPQRHQLLRMAAALACCLALMATAFHFLPQPPEDLVTVSSQSPGGTLNPVTSPPSDELSLSVSDVQLLSETELSLILTVRGDRVDPLTDIDLQNSAEHISIYRSSLSNVDEAEDRKPNELRFKYTIETRDTPILDALEDTLTLTVFRYTVGTTESEPLHDVDWANMDYTLPEAGEPIIDLGNDMAVTGFGITDEGWTTVQIRWPFEALEPTTIILSLQPAEQKTPQRRIYVRTGEQYYAGGYIYYNWTFPVHPDELQGAQLATYILLVPEDVYGEWSTTVDLTALKAE